MLEWAKSFFGNNDPAEENAVQASGQVERVDNAASVVIPDTSVVSEAVGGGDVSVVTNQNADDSYTHTIEISGLDKAGVAQVERAMEGVQEGFKASEDGARVFIKDVEVSCEVGDGVSPEAVEVKHFSQEEAVANIQEYLIARDHDNVGDAKNNVDSMFGNGTGAALENELRLIQEQAGLDVTGEYDADTRAALIARADAATNDGVSDMMVQFVEGLDAMQSNMVDGESALERVYSPGDYGVAQSECSITIVAEQSANVSAFSLK